MKKYVKSVIALGVLLLPAQHVMAADGKYRAIIDRFGTEFVIPAYEELSKSSENMDAAAIALCQAPSEKLLSAAHEAYKVLIASWSYAEVIRIGPIRDQGRLERLFFWPDVRSRGLKQVQRRLNEDPEKLTDVLKVMRQTSVATQGLPALEYLLHPKSGAVSAQFKEAGNRCAFLKAVTGNIREISDELLGGWRGPKGYHALMMSYGPKNPIYRTESEVMQDIIKMPVELLQLLEESKIRSSLGKSAENPKPKRAPFWRSNLTLVSFERNTAAVIDLFETLKLDDLVEDENAHLRNSFLFEGRQVTQTFKALEAKAINWTELVISQDGYEKLEYVRHPLRGMRGLLSEDYPEMLGLKLGFNSLDGD